MSSWPRVAAHSAQSFGAPSLSWVLPLFLLATMTTVGFAAAFIRSMLNLERPNVAFLDSVLTTAIIFSFVACVFSTTIIDIWGGRYLLPAPDVVRANGKFNSLAQFVQAVRRAGPCMTVVKTSTGAAQSVAVAIDKAQWPEVVGTLSGDDTIFIATGNARAQQGIVSRLREMFRV